MIQYLNTYLVVYFKYEEFLMYGEFLSFKKLLDNNTMQIINNTIVKTYSYLYIDEELVYEPNQEIYKNLKESETIFIDQIKEIDQTSPIQYFIISFKKKHIHDRSVIHNIFISTLVV